MIAGMTGVIIDMTDAITEMTATIDGIADEIAIIIIAETLIGIATHATTTDSASPRPPGQQI
jgi:hypothetical protein